MGKPTGFIELDRLPEQYEKADGRVKHYKEFVLTLPDAEAALQGARCMDCGIPFCNNGCPVNNIIPDWNDLVYQGDWKNALRVLHSTNNFPEFTGRICPAPCEEACTLNINNDAVGIKSIERAIIDKGWSEGWVAAQPAAVKTGKTVAVVGSGPAGLAAAQQLARAGHDVTVFEKNQALGGLLRYGIPDFKMEKHLIDRRIEQMQAEGVRFRSQVCVGAKPAHIGINDDSLELISAADLQQQFDAVLLAAGSEVPRDLPVPGRDLAGVHFALEFLIPQNKQVAGGAVNPISAKGKNVVVIGGGDTGSDCVGTSYRHGAKSVTQFELMPQPPERENKALVWPYWPLKLRTSSSHGEGKIRREYAIATKEFIGENGKLKGLTTVRIEFANGKMQEVTGSEEHYECELALFAMGFTNPVASLLETFAVIKDKRQNALAETDGSNCYLTSCASVFAAGDVRRGQSLVVWAIREGRQAAREIDQFLMGKTSLPR